MSEFKFGKTSFWISVTTNAGGSVLNLLACFEVFSVLLSPYCLYFVDSLLRQTIPLGARRARFGAGATATAGASGNADNDRARDMLRVTALVGSGGANHMLAPATLRGTAGGSRDDRDNDNVMRGIRAGPGSLAAAAANAAAGTAGGLANGVRMARR